MICAKIPIKSLSAWTPSTTKNVAAIQLLAVAFILALFIFYYYKVLIPSTFTIGDAFAAEYVVTTNVTMPLHKLSEHIQSVLQRLQWHPTPNCSSAKTKLLICPLDILCGFGCTFHHISHCLLLASGGNRTLVFKDDGLHWIYNRTAGWESIFQPITNCKYSQSIRPNEQIVEYTGPAQTDRVVHVPRRNFLNYDKEHTYPVIPSELTNAADGLLAKQHPNPPYWFIAQVMKFLWKLNAQTQRFIDEAEAKIPFDKGPIVGIHVRRTDKIEEAKYQELKEYMKWVDLWYDEQQQQQQQENGGIGSQEAAITDRNDHNNSNKNDSAAVPRRLLFIATDEPAVLDEAKRDYGDKNGYEIFSRSGNNSIKKGTNSAEELRGFISDIQILVRCNYVVCTFSSNICRLIYELKQLKIMEYHLYGNDVHSLDREGAYDAAFPWDGIKKEHMQMAREQLGTNRDGSFNSSLSATSFLPIHWFRNASFPIFQMKE